MSEIDSYKHECIGIVSCPTPYWPVRSWGQGGTGNTDHHEIALYLLHEDALDGDSFEAKRGDLLLGGGSGEAPALWISMPEAIIFFGCDPVEAEKWFDLEHGDLHDGLYHAYWSANDAFIFCEGYSKLGWNPEAWPMELWLVGHILSFVLREYPNLWPPICEVVLPVLDSSIDGSICRLPEEEEKAML